MSKSKMAAIDGSRLRSLVEATGLTLPDASEQLGFSRKYLSDICRDGRAPVQSMSLIALVLNIPQELYRIREKQPEPEESPPETEETVETLLRMILQELREIKEIGKEKDYEQKVWALPFADSGSDPDRSDHHVSSCNL